MSQEEIKLNADIMKVTMQIKEKHPELSKYLGEMPVTIPDEKNPDVDLRVLHAYYESLIDLLKRYVEYSATKKP